MSPKVTPELEDRIKSCLGQGRSLPSDSQEFFEDRFGFDFSQINIHTDSEAAELSRSLNAQAFTIGQDIFFGPGRFQPETRDGQRLLAHELVHVVQQGHCGEVRNSHPFLVGVDTLSFQESSNIVESSEPTDVGRNAVVQQHINQPVVQRQGETEDGGLLSGIGEFGAGLLESGRSALGSAFESGRELLGAGLEAASEFFMDIVERLAPGLITFVRGGFVPRLTNLLCTGIDRTFGAALGRLPGIDFMAALENLFEQQRVGVESFIDGIKGGIGKGLGALLRPVVNALDIFDQEFFDRLNERLEEISNTFQGIWDSIGAPVADFLQMVGGELWNGLVTMATRVWELTRPIREGASAAWDWLKRQFNLAWDSSESTRSWLLDKANEIWLSLKENLQPVLEPLRKVGKVLLLFTPAGPIAILFEVIPPLWEKLKWLWDNWNTDDILVRAREILHDEILPPIINNVARVGEALSGAATWLSGLTSQLSESFATLLNAVGISRCLTTVNRLFNSLCEQFTRFANWAQAGFGGLERLMIKAFESIKAVLKPVLDFVALLIQTALNPLQIPLFIAGSLWRLIPEDLKRPIINFLLNLMESFVRAMPNFMPGLFALGAIIKRAILGFFARIKEETEKIKIAVTDRIAKLLAGGSIEFIAGWFKGILRGIWDGITDPFRIIFMLVKAVVGVSRFLVNTVRSLVSEPAPAETVGEEQTGVPAVLTPSPTTIAALETAVNTTATAETEWETAQDETFEQDSGITFDRILSILRSVWDKVLEKAGQIGDWLAGKLLEIYQISDFQLGDNLGFFAGIIIFEVILFLLTAGAWAGVTASRPILRAILRLLDLGGEILGGLMRLLGPIHRPLMNALGAIADFLGGIRPLRAVIDKITEALRAVFRYGDEVAGATGRTAGEGVEELTEESAERLAAETLEEFGEEAAERAGRETAEEVGEEAGVRTTRETVEITGRIPQTPEEILESFPQLSRRQDLLDQTQRIMDTGVIPPARLKEIMDASQRQRTGGENMLRYLENFSNNPRRGLDQVLGDLALGGNKFSGAEWMLRYIDSNGLWGRVGRYEVLEAAGELGGRRYDAIIDGIRYQFKNWGEFRGGTFTEQILKDFEITGGNLDNLKWVFAPGRIGDKDAIQELMSQTLRRLPDEETAELIIQNLDKIVVVP